MEGFQHLTETLTYTEKHTDTFIKNYLGEAKNIQEECSFQTIWGGTKRVLHREPSERNTPYPPHSLPPAFPDPANSLQPLRGDPVVTLRAASPCTFKAPGVEQYTASHPELLK